MHPVHTGFIILTIVIVFDNNVVFALKFVEFLHFYCLILTMAGYWLIDWFVDESICEQTINITRPKWWKYISLYEFNSAWYIQALMVSMKIYKSNIHHCITQADKRLIQLPATGTTS